MARRKTRSGARRRNAAPAADAREGTAGASRQTDDARQRQPRGRRTQIRRPGVRAGPLRAREALEAVLHPRPADGAPWKHLPLVLALAFAVRAAVALSGDFVLHPDEIMQYLEPAHRLVFGTGITFWEYFYGARSWLVPGLVAGVLTLFDTVGLGQPRWYVGGVELTFCAISLAIPAGMYFFARHHFSEASARAALLAGAFWYELAGFAHKPMTEFVATAALVPLMALCVRPAGLRERSVWPAVGLAVLAGAVRLQYAPFALVLLGVVFVRSQNKTRLALAAAGLVLAVGVFDAVTWDGGLFHSYVTNVRFNLALGAMRAGESPPWQYLEWLAIAGAGLGVPCVVAALLRPGRYAFLLALITLVLAIHSLQEHKEYRFVFVVVPLWLLIGADLVARAAEFGHRAHRPGSPERGTPIPERGARVPEDEKRVPERGARVPEDGKRVPERGARIPEDGKRVPERGARIPEDGKRVPERGARIPEDGKRVPERGARIPEDGKRVLERWIGATAAGLFAAVSVAGVLNALPFQDRLYRAWSNETGAVRFVRRHDPIFAAYRHLATAPGVGAVWQTDRAHYNLPGYYYLHRAIPFYDTVTVDSIRRGGPELTATVSHIVSADPDLAVPGYSVEREFGAVRILRRDESEPPVRRWQAYAPVLVDELTERIMHRVDPHAPPAPANAGIRFEGL